MRTLGRAADTWPTRVLISGPGVIFQPLEKKVRKRRRTKSYLERVEGQGRNTGWGCDMGNKCRA